MLKLKDVLDIVRRRTRFYLKKHKFSKIYTNIDTDRNRAEIIFITKDDSLSPMDITELNVIYAHLFEDVADTYTVRVLGKDKRFKTGDNTYLLWVDRLGFVSKMY